jgi:predicted ATPase
LTLLQRLDEHLESPGALVGLHDWQQTLTGTIEWSYNLLPASARQLPARLSVFAAPFTAGRPRRSAAGMPLAR